MVTIVTFDKREDNPLDRHKPLPTDTLYRALDKLRAGRWAEHRSKDVLYAQGMQAINSLRKIAIQTPLDNPLVDHITPANVSWCIAEWQAEKLAPDTIRKRLNVLRAMGVDLGAASDRPKLSKKRPLKWWLNPTDEDRLVAWLQSLPGGAAMHGGEAKLLAQYIRFVTRSGLRVEEALALTPSMLSYTFPTAGGDLRERASITVEGTKTAGSHATLPLMSEAWDALELAWRQEHGTDLATAGNNHAARDTPVFRFARGLATSYNRLAVLWEYCRIFLGQKENPTATLKALRRSAARYLHISKGMPLDMVREYLRHDDIATTQGYLKLTGGYGEAEMRRFL